MRSQLPSRDLPDFIEDMSDWEMVGVPGPGQGSGVGHARWKMGLQKLIWTVGGAGGGMREGMLRLNSTVWYSRNSSGSAPLLGRYIQGGVSFLLNDSKTYK